MSKLLTQKQVAALLGVTVRTVRNWERRGIFPSGARVHGRGRGKLVRYVSDDVARVLSEWVNAGKLGTKRKRKEKRGLTGE